MIKWVPLILLLSACEEHTKPATPLIVTCISDKKTCISSAEVELCDTLGNTYTFDCTHTLAIAVSRNNKEGDTLW